MSPRHDLSYASTTSCEGMATQLLGLTVNACGRGAERRRVGLGETIRRESFDGRAPVNARACACMILANVQKRMWAPARVRMHMHRPASSPACAPKHARTYTHARMHACMKVMPQSFTETRGAHVHKRDRQLRTAIQLMQSPSLMRRATHRARHKRTITRAGHGSRTSSNSHTLKAFTQACTYGHAPTRMHSSAMLAKAQLCHKTNSW
eukprot:1706596-Pleurochrysis_carterae.AAC.1